MREDPVARRNRGNSTIGLWVLGGLAVLVALLVGVDLLRPTPAPAPLSEPAPAAVSMKQRVANEEIEAIQRDRARARPASQTPAA